jgi:putative restriction endonuclease
MNTLKEAYKVYLFNNNRAGSNKAASYLRALELLNIILKDKNRLPVDITDIWKIKSSEIIYQLYSYALNHQKKEGSDFLRSDFPASYGRNGYYSAALRSLGKFFLEMEYDKKLLPKLEEMKSGADVAETIEKANIPENSILFEEKDSKITGTDMLKKVKTRMNQNIFRKFILKIYNIQCCITGLDIPQLLVASHIKPWSIDKRNRLNPSNGLCLNTLHDKAFDIGLITLDEDFKILVSKEIKEHYGKDAVKKYFQPYDGKSIALPNRFIPEPDLLKYHREKIFMGK